MSHLNTIFHQLQQFIPGHQFEKLISKYSGDRYAKAFTCKNQLSVMLYAQATGKDSLRDIQTGLFVNQSKLYHLGIRSIAKSTISHANKRIDYRIYEELFYNFLERCKDITPTRKFKFKNPLYALDSTVVDLCLKLFPWAKFRTAKGAIKIHPLLNLRTQIPEVIVITDGKQSDVKVAKSTEWNLSSDSILVVDRAYIDWKWLSGLGSEGVNFVTRSKKNMQYGVIGQHKTAPSGQCIKDEKILLKNLTSLSNYSKPLRRIEWLNKKTGEVLVFITNNFEFSARTIAGIYKSRWDIELFFKWLKQHLKIKTFLGTSENAVKTQIWIAMIYYLLLKYIKYQTKYGYSLLEFTRIIGEALFFRQNLIDLLSMDYKNFKRIRDPDPQLALF
ncbi:MAG: IS4 family transposase [Nanoarchaeota archaeon]|nr:IS4 family transposase [Nanoarchaeota archaeon]